MFWGPRAVEESARYLSGLVQSGRYRIEQCNSAEMKTLLGDLANEYGRAFTIEVSELCQTNKIWEIDTEVAISPHGKLIASKDLGDIDVLIIDSIRLRIYSLECKDTGFARNARELANEVENFDANHENSWMQKHLQRDKWIKENLATLSTTYAKDLHDYRVSSALVCSEVLPTSFISGSALPILSLSELKRDGIQSIEKIVP